MWNAEVFQIFCNWVINFWCFWAWECRNLSCYGKCARTRACWIAQIAYSIFFSWCRITYFRFWKCSRKLTVSVTLLSLFPLSSFPPRQKISSHTSTQSILLAPLLFSSLIFILIPINFYLLSCGIKQVQRALLPVMWYLTCIL